ncbi:MAG: hypothetical protein ACK4M4_03000 [Flavobacterium sp.]
MKRIKLRVFMPLLMLLLLLVEVANAQEAKAVAPDQLLKESLYSKSRVKVLNFSLKQFDALFFEFFDKKLDPNVLLSKEQFYTYTMQIAAFSERLAKLYPDQKDLAAENKKKWFGENYEDYLLSKAPEKK